MNRQLYRWLLAVLLPLAACKGKAVTFDAEATDVSSADRGDVPTVRADGPPDAGSDLAPGIDGPVDLGSGEAGDASAPGDGGTSCGDAQCAPSQYCVALLGGPRLFCYDRPEAGPCPANTTEGCDDPLQAAAGRRCQEIRNTWGDCKDLPPTCTSADKCTCFCPSSVCSVTDRHLACNNP